MSTSFNVNKADLEFILKQIILAETTSVAYTPETAPLTMLAAIQAAFPDIGVTEASLLPFGLRTVDGTYNNLLPTQGDFGAADTLFPRLTDPVFRVETDNDSIDFDGAGPAPTLIQGDYGVLPDASPAPGLQPGVGTVIDADPRIISNLIVDMTPGNPAAVEAALKYLVFTGAMDEATAAAAAPAIIAAYAQTVQTRAAAAPANVAVLLATRNTEIGEQATAQADYNTALDADTYRDPANLADLSDNAAAAVVGAIDVVGSTIFGATVDQTDIDNATAAVAAAQAAYDAAVLVRVALAGGLTGEAAALTVETDALSLLGALQVYLSGDGGVTTDGLILGELVEAGDELQSVLDAAATAATNLTNAQALTSTLTPLVDPLGDVATTLTALNTANGQLAAAQSAYNAASNPATVTAADAALIATLATYGVEVDPSGSLVIPNTAPDAGLTAPFNSAMTFFGQFFDHGLDLVTKGGNGTVYIPLMADDPLIAGKDGVLGTIDDLDPNLRFMALTRATVTMVDGVPQHENTTTSFVDQNQTYTSHSSHQVFLREYVRVDTNDDNVADTTVATGRLIDGSTASGSTNGAPGNWAEVKAQALEMLGIELSDFDIHNVPLLVTDQYGKFIPGENGYAQMVLATGTIVNGVFVNDTVSGTAAGISTAGSLGTGHAFLNDIAHHAAPGRWDSNGDGRVTNADALQTADIDPGTTDDGLANTYDDEMLNSHFITGDGRGNENIALTAMHAVFHSEHNRTVEVNKATIIASGDVAFLNEWLRVNQADNLTADQVRDLNPASLQWDGERLFQAARFTTEMQYQHLVFEEFARRVQPDVDPFIFNPDSTIDPSILAEFAHTVYRFGHTMLTGTVDRLENDLTTVNDEADQQTLLAAFLNPQMYIASGVDNSTAMANVVRGLTLDVGNAIDEFIVQDVRSNLLGLPLDLAVLNIARGRDTGIPSLNETRQQLHDAGVSILTPYTSWLDFESNINNRLSSVNFMAAYGTHASLSLTDAEKLADPTRVITAAEMRDAALLLRLGDGTANDIPAVGVVPAVDVVTIRGVNYTDRLDFLNATGAYAKANDVSLGGLNKIDLWIGGLAEKRPEFGSAMLGQTFNYVFEFQMEQLQFGDRFYYLSRTQGTNFLNQLEPNTFSDLVMRNSKLGGDYATHMSSAMFLTPDHILELDRGIAQADYNVAVAETFFDVNGNGRYDVADTFTDANANGIYDAHNDPDWATAPSLPVEKVSRNYTGSTTVINPVDGTTHDVGGSIIFRGAEHTVIGGTEGNDYIRTDEGDDTIWGDGGNDHLISGDGVDNVFGGDGDDIIEDIEGAGDFLRGERGNDVIVSARGAFDVLFGGEGKDFVQVGVDVMEVFAGEGDDFVLGGAGSDLLMGNEGNDWIEGGGGFDTLVGENSDLFFNSPVIGHDVLFGNGDETDMDAESGDDIMASSPSVFRNEGMFGFDWGIAKFDQSQIYFDLGIPIFTTDQADILRDRWDQVEALSGWNGNDVLKGDDRGGVDAASFPSGLAPSALFVNNVLDQEGITRIVGLQQLLGSAGGTLGINLDNDNNPLTPPPVNTTNQFYDGNILLGGDGNDEITGRGGYDVIDGDAWLNVRIRIDMGNGVVYSAESLSSDTAVMGQNAGKVYATDANFDPIFTKVVNNVVVDAALFGGRTLPALLLDRTINPGEMSIVREIKYDNTNVTIGRNVDTAVYQGTMGEYIIEGLETSDINYTGDVISHAQDLDGDGFIFVRDTNTGAGAVIQALDINGNVIDVAALPRAVAAGGGAQLTDDLDLLKHIEQLKFSDRTFAIGDPSAIVNWNGVRPTSETALPANGVVIANLSTTDVDNTPVIWSLRPGGTAPVTVSTGGVVTTTAALVVNSVYTLTVRATETGNPTAFVDKIISIRTGTAGDNTIIGSGLTDVIYGLDGRDTLNGFGGSDTLFGQADRDILNGGVGNDDLTGGIDDDIVNGGSGADTIRYVIGDGIDEVDGGTGIDRLIISAAGGDDTLLVKYDGPVLGLTEFGSIGVAGVRGTVTGVEQVTANLGGGVNDDIDYFGSTVAVTVDLGAGTASGFTSIAGIEHAAGSDFNDILISAAGIDNELWGYGGNDTFTVHDAGDQVFEDANEGNDTVRSAITYTITDVDVENLTLIGAADINGTGNGSANVLTGNDGNNTLNGLGGNDTINGGIGADTLVGGAGNDTINGGAGDDTITYVVGTGTNSVSGIDTVDGGLGTDTLAITSGAGIQTLLVKYDGTGLTEFGEQGPNGIRGTVTGVENVTANLGAGANDDIDYFGSTASVTVNLGAGTASGFTSIIGIESAGGGDSNDILTGSAGANELFGEGGNDTINGGGGVDNIDGGTGADIITGGAGADIIDTGADNDNLADLIRFSAADEFGDTITNFDANGTVDRIEFGGALNARFDDGLANDNFLFVTSNGIAAVQSVDIGTANIDIEALVLTGVGGEGVTNALLRDAAAVSTAVNNAFDFTDAGNGQDVLLVVNDTDANSASVWQWIQATGGETSAAELTLIGVINANDTVTAASFDLF